MRILVFALVPLLAACGGLSAPLCPGTRSYDIQLCRGEKPQFIPNAPYAALQRKAKCEVCVDIDQNCVWGVPKKCEPKWQWSQQ